MVFKLMNMRTGECVFTRDKNLCEKILYEKNGYHTVIRYDERFSAPVDENLIIDSYDEFKKIHL